MEPSNLSINSSQQSASQFFQGSVASLKSWGCRVCQQLHHHREILHTYSPKTKIGLLIAVNAFFFVGIRTLVNYLEERGNRTNPEKTGLHAIISPVLFGVAIAGVNIGLSKLARYQLPALTLYAITISSVAVYLILKRPQPLLAPIREEISSELEQINRHLETLNRDQTELRRQESLISARLTNTSSTSSLPQPSASTPTLPQSPTSTPPSDVPQPEDQAELQRVQAQLVQNANTQRNLTELQGTLRQEAVVVSQVERNIPSSPRTPERVNLLRTSLRNRLDRTLNQSGLVASQSGLNLPSSAPPSTPVHSNSSPQPSRTPGAVTPPSSPGTQVQTSSSSSPSDTTINQAPSSPAPLSSTPAPAENSPIETNPTDSSTSEPPSTTEPSDSTSQPNVDPNRILQTPQSMTRWLIIEGVRNFGPVVIQNAPSIASSVFSFISGR